jgi:uncharacterized protein
MKTDIFVNLAVKDLKKTMAFFSELGFKYNPMFTNEYAACMILNEQANVMFLTESFFKTFTKKEVADAHKTTEVLISISAKNRDGVNEFMEKALAMNAIEVREPQEFEYMYMRSFSDLDGHIWEVGWLDVANFPKQS